MSPDSHSSDQPIPSEAVAPAQSKFNWQGFHDALAEYRQELASQNPDLPNDLAYLLIHDTTDYLDGATLEDLTKIVDETLQFMREAGQEVTDAEKVHIMAGAFPNLEEAAVVHLGKCLELSQDTWYVTIRDLIEETYGPDLSFTFGPEVVASLNRLAAMAGVAPIEKTDPALITAIFWRVANHIDTGVMSNYQALVHQVAAYGIDLYDFIKIAQAHCSEKFTHHQVDENSEIAVRAVLEQVTRQRLDEPAVRAELAKHGLETSPWLSFAKLADWVSFWFREAPIDGDDVEDFAERLWQLKVFAPELLKSFEVRAAAQHLIGDGYTIEHDNTILARSGFTLEELAGSVDGTWDDDLSSLPLYD